MSLKSLNVSPLTFEKVLFLIVCLLNLWPIIGVDFYTSLDGPAHVYNANLIYQLLSESNGLVSEYFKFNTIAVPNWTGHVIMLLLLKVVPASLVEKSLALIIAISLPYSFRSLLKTVASESGIWLSFLIFPFVYSFTFFLGFYNFAIGLILLFVLLKYWLKNKAQLNSSLTKSLGLMGLIIVLYFSHLVAFFVFYLVVLTIEASEVLNNNSLLRTCIKRLGLLAALSIPALVGFVNFYSNRLIVEEEIKYIDFSTLIEWFYNLRTLIVFNVDYELKYTSLIFYCIAILAVIAIILLIRKIYKSGFNRFETLRIAMDSPFFIAFIFLTVLFFVLPDSDGVGSIILTRIQWLMFVFLIIALAKTKFPRWIVFTVVPIVLYASFQLNTYYLEVQNNRGKVAEEVINLIEKIEDKSTVGVAGGLSNWTFVHFSNLIGIEGQRPVFRNYEAARGNFPILWSNDSGVYYDFEKQNDWRKNKMKVKPDYYLIQGGLEKLQYQELKQNINENYSLISESDHYDLVKAKKP